MLRWFVWSENAPGNANSVEYISYLSALVELRRRRKGDPSAKLMWLDDNGPRYKAERNWREWSEPVWQRKDSDT